jgi:putative endonuclease
MHYLYIIYSERIDRYYIGETMDLHRRLIEHNTGVFKGCFTRRSADWSYALTIGFSNKSKAQQAERFVKRMNSRKFTENLILDWEWLRDRFENE